MIIYLDLTEEEFQRYKRKYPVLKSVSNDTPPRYFFETQNPYIEFGLKVGLPEELEIYVIKEK
jgi:hypothetical protein